MRLTLENCASIYSGTLQKTYKKKIVNENPGITWQEKFDLIQAELDNFTVNNQFFKYTTIKNRLGGYRWFFLCPKCNSRVGKLFLPPKNEGLERKYFCKKCHNLRNQSAVMGQNRIYKQVTKPLKRLKEIEKKLENGYLGNAKIKALLDEYEAIENRMKDTSEYRLYAFKRTRALK